MSMGYALREQYPIDENCKPIQKYGSLGLFRSHEVPKIKAIVVDKPGLKVACGAIGIGEITSIPTAPAIADAYSVMMEFADIICRLQIHHTKGRVDMAAKKRCFHTDPPL